MCGSHPGRPAAAAGVKLLWATQNMFSHPRFMNGLCGLRAAQLSSTVGASTNPDLDVFAWACAKTKMAMDAGHKLGAESHVFWGGGRPVGGSARRACKW